MWPTRLSCPEETLRSLRLWRDCKAATLLMAEQEDQPDKDSLEPAVFRPRLLESSLLWVEFTEAVAYGRSQMSALQPPNALEGQTENIHLRYGWIHTRS